MTTSFGSESPITCASCGPRLAVLTGTSTAPDQAQARSSSTSKGPFGRSCDDAVAGLDSGLAQRAGAKRGPLRGLGKGPRLTARTQERRLGEPCGPFAEKRGDRALGWGHKERSLTPLGHGATVPLV